MQKGYEDATCEKFDSTPRNKKTVGQTKRIRRSIKYTELCSWAISGGFLEREGSGRDQRATWLVKWRDSTLS